MEVAERYFAAVDSVCSQLSRHPLSGTLHDPGVARLKGLRRVPVGGFENYLVFYLPRQGGIDVVRVLHGARDIDNLFAEQEA